MLIPQERILKIITSNTLSYKVFEKILNGTSRRLKGYSIHLESLKVLLNFYRLGISSAPKIFSFTTKQELLALYKLASVSPRGSTALEIGSHLGKSSCYLAAGLITIGGKLYCIDTWQNETMPDGIKDTFAEFKQNTSGISNCIISIRKRSDELALQDIPGKLNLVFIDGDHSYLAVKSDFEKVAPHVIVDGVVAFHDVLFYEGVSKLVGEVLTTGMWRTEGQVENLIWVRKLNKSDSDFSNPERGL